MCEKVPHKSQVKRWAVIAYYALVMIFLGGGAAGVGGGLRVWEGGCGAPQREALFPPA